MSSVVAQPITNPVQPAATLEPLAALQTPREFQPANPRTERMLKITERRVGTIAMVGSLLPDPSDDYRLKNSQSSSDDDFVMLIRGKRESMPIQCHTSPTGAVFTILLDAQQVTLERVRELFGESERLARAADALSRHIQNGERYSEHLAGRIASELRVPAEQLQRAVSYAKTALGEDDNDDLVFSEALSLRVYYQNINHFLGVDLSSPLYPANAPDPRQAAAMPAGALVFRLRSNESNELLRVGIYSGRTDAKTGSPLVFTLEDNGWDLRPLDSVRLFSGESRSQVSFVKFVPPE